MGLSNSSKTSTQTNAPSTFAQPYINAGASALQTGYGQSAPIASDVSSTIASSLPTLAANAFTPDAGVAAATGYNTDVLNGKYLGSGNPYLASQIASTDNSVANRVQSQFSQAGRTGSGANTNALAAALANSENGLRYTDYSNERQAMAQAASEAPALASSKYAGLGSYLQAAGTAVALPETAASGYSGSLGSLLGQYNTTTGTQTTNPSTASNIGTGLQLASLLFSDRRLKTGIRKLGEYTDGLGRYAYRYVWGGPEQQGVMADEVAVLRPWALGPKIAGFRTVNYGAL